MQIQFLNIIFVTYANQKLLYRHTVSYDTNYHMYYCYILRDVIACLKQKGENYPRIFVSAIGMLQ